MRIIRVAGAQADFSEGRHSKHYLPADGRAHSLRPAVHLFANAYRINLQVC